MSLKASPLASARPPEITFEALCRSWRSPPAADSETKRVCEGSAADKEEERRLMYVALTRAQDKIYLSYAAYRTVFGTKNACQVE